MADVGVELVDLGLDMPPQPDHINRTVRIVDADDGEGVGIVLLEEGNCTGQLSFGMLHAILLLGPLMVHKGQVSCQSGLVCVGSWNEQLSGHFLCRGGSSCWDAGLLSNHACDAASNHKDEQQLPAHNQPYLVDFLCFKLTGLRFRTRRPA